MKKRKKKKEKRKKKKEEGFVETSYFGHVSMESTL